MSDQTSQNTILFFFLALFIISMAFLGWLLWPFFSILVLAFVVTGIFSPVYRFLSTKMKPSLASAATCVLIFFVLFLPIVLFTGIVTRETMGFLETAKNAAMPDQIKAFLNNSQLLEKTTNFFGNYGVKLTEAEFTRAASELGQFVGGFLLEQTRAVAYNIMKFVANFFFMLLIIYFFLIDSRKLLDFIIDISPLPRDQDEQLVIKFKEMSGAILLGNGVCGLIQGCMGGAVFAVFGLPSAFLWGVVMGILAFLPIVGVGLIFLPAAAILFIKGKVGAAIFFVIFYALLSFSMEYIVKPKLVGDRVKMHPLLVFLAIVGGLKLFGILGVIYGPLMVTFFLTLTDIYHTSYQSILEPPEKSRRHLESQPKNS